MKHYMNLSKKLLMIVFTMFLLPVVTVSETKTLKYSDHEPLGGMRTKFIKDVFFAAIEKESNGRLKIEDHWDSKISNGYDALRIVGKEGTADMTIVVPEYSANELPLHQMFKSFPVGPTGAKQVTFFRRVYAEIPAFSAELEKENVVNIFLSTGYPVAFFSTKPLTNLKDLKGERWRSASFWHKDFLQNVGATPVTMPWNDGIFTALRDGTLDGLMVNIDGGEQLKVRDGGKCAAKAVLRGVVRVGARTHARDHVTELQVLLQRARRTHSDDALDIVLREQLVGVDTDGRHPHAAGHHADENALVGACVALHAADVVDELWFI